LKRSLLDLVREPFAFLCKSRPPPWLRPHPQLPLGLTQSEPFLEQNHQKIHFSERSLPEHQNQRNWYHSDPLFKTEVPPTSRQHPISMLRVSLQSILSSNFRSLSGFFFQFQRCLCPCPGGMPSVRGRGAGSSVLILMVAAPMLSVRRPKSATGSAERHTYMVVMCSA
jgi:hypothetical protein